jgi:hypothetical protein
MHSLLARICGLLVFASAACGADDPFRTQVAPVLERHCVRCHSGAKAKGDVDLSSAATVAKTGGLIVAGRPDESLLIEVITGDKPRMPESGDPLAPADVDVLKKWITEGATWPADVILRDDPSNWWSLRPLETPRLPELNDADRTWARTPIDFFIVAKLRELGLSPSPEADRRTLIRRLSFDLTGLPPSPEDVERFVSDANPQAYEELIDRLLKSPQYGERWAQHWLDVVHYADTHGYDKDKVRPNAWPYRDYVIRSFNTDKPYREFVREQLAGDRLATNPADGIPALGFIAAGPFDFVGQIEVADGSMEKQRVRNIDRDDMVSVTINTFVSLTAQCARCHDHKFDPITQADYYSLQAVFAAVDRADRTYDVDPHLHATRSELQQRERELTNNKSELERKLHDVAGPELAALDATLAELYKQGGSELQKEFGYHSAIEQRPDVEKWVQVDLREPRELDRIVLIGAHDEFAGIGAGFGFPVRYRIDVSNDPEFQSGVVAIADHSSGDVPNPGTVPQTSNAIGAAVRYVRVTATRLAPRQNDFIFALAELQALTKEGKNVAAGKPVAALDSIEAPVRWARSNLVDGIYRGAPAPDVAARIGEVTAQRDELLNRTVDAAMLRELADVESKQANTFARLHALPLPQYVFAAATEFVPQGQHTPTHGMPRPISVLARGNEQQPLEPVGSGTVGCIAGLPSRFDLEDNADESNGRGALAEWIVDPRNSLTWRSIVNRVWHYHFGRGNVETPNDFGRMGATPTHPELLDWLAVEFRDGPQSLKDLHRLIVTSAVYRQSSADNPQSAAIDADNRYLWRMNRRRLEGEEIRDAVLAVSGKLRLDGGGPAFRAFGFKDDHSPHYLYDEHDPDDPASHRRSVYRFIVRSAPDPFLTTLDCADPSLLVERRNETITPLQALALLNNTFMVRMAEHVAERASAASPKTSDQITAIYRLAFQRDPTADELAVLTPLAEQHGLANICRLVLNMNEFVFVE